MNTVLNETAIPAVTFTVDEIHLDDRHGPLTRSEILRWLLEQDLARPNGSPSTFELTQHGLEVARETAELHAWLRS